MSFTSSISIQVLQGGFVALLKTMLQNGWSLDNGHGNMGYCVENEAEELFDWQSQPLSADEPLAVLEHAEMAHKAFAVALTFMKDQDSHTLMVFPRQRRLVLSLGPNRRQLPGVLPFTDTTWYTEAIVGLLLRHKISVESLAWNEHV